MLLAARHGTAIEGGILYSTFRPCFGCLKEAIQAGIKEIVYQIGAPYEDELEEAYQSLKDEAGIGFRQLKLDAPASTEQDSTEFHQFKIDALATQ